jgi:hypothetical protein
MASLRQVKVLHTVIWAFFSGCILAIPVLTALSSFKIAFALVGIVAVEVVILVFNGMRCPLTDVAARYSDETHANFDIYLPEWLARNNQLIFGSLYALFTAILLARWLRVH